MSKIVATKSELEQLFRKAIEPIPLINQDAVTERFTKALSSLPTLKDELDKFSRWIQENDFEFTDGSWYYSEDEDGDNPLNLYELYQHYLTTNR